MTITGLPLHPLVIHAVVVLLPLMALLTVVVAVRKSLRERVAWWVVAGNAGILAVTVLPKRAARTCRSLSAARLPWSTARSAPSSRSLPW